MLWPNGTRVKPYVTSSFGPRNLANPNASKYHRGVDMVGFREVKAIEAGQVKVIGTPNGWYGGGTQVWVQHDGYFSRYLHLASYFLKNNQFVREGETLGIMGTTPKVDLHLHLEVSPGRVHYSNSGQIDPVPFISARIGGSPAGGGSTSPEEDDMSVEDIYNARDDDGRNMLDLGRQTRSDIANLRSYMDVMLSQVPAEVWKYSIPAQDGKGNPLLIGGKPVLFSSSGFIASTNAAVSGQVADIDEVALAQALAPLITENLSSLSTEDIAKIAKATADEQARRLAVS